MLNCTSTKHPHFPSNQSTTPRLGGPTFPAINIFPSSPPSPPRSSAPPTTLLTSPHHTTATKMTLQAIKYTRGHLSILDQLQLPHTTHYDAIYSSTDAWHAIKDMRTRGAPAIAIVAALSLAVELCNMKLASHGVEVAAFIYEKLDYLVTSRPTAVNLGTAVRELKGVVGRAEGEGAEAVKEAYVGAAEKMLEDDVADNEAIGRFGGEWIWGVAGGKEGGKVSVVTHCNTG